jgi:hypothetical protein
MNAEVRSQGAEMLACADLLKQRETKSDDFLDIVTRDEIWVHCSELESKQQSMEWSHKDSPRKKKLKAQHGWEN